MGCPALAPAGERLPDGTHAAVGTNGYVSYVQLSPGPVALVKTMSTTVGRSRHRASGERYVYAFPRIDHGSRSGACGSQPVPRRSARGTASYAGTKPKLHPAAAAIYGPDNGLSPSDIEKYDVSAGTASYLYDLRTTATTRCAATLDLGGGLRIFTHAATRPRATTQGSDMTLLRGRRVDDTLCAGWPTPPPPDSDGHPRLRRVVSAAPDADASCGCS